MDSVRHRANRNFQLDLFDKPAYPENMATMYVMEPASSQIALLHRISSIVSSELSLDEMLGEIVGLTVQVTECDACLVYLLERETGEIVLRASQVPHAVDYGNIR